MRRALPLAALLLAAGAAGCSGPATTEAEPIWLGPPALEAGGFVACASSSAQEMAIPGLRADVTRDAQGRAPGVHRVDATTVLWVLADYVDTQREDRVTRLNPVTVHREPDGQIVICTEVDLAGELFGGGDVESYALAATFTAPGGWPEAPTHAVVNWAFGCGGCPVLRGNTTGHWG